MAQVAEAAGCPLRRILSLCNKHCRQGHSQPASNAFPSLPCSLSDPISKFSLVECELKWSVQLPTPTSLKGNCCRGFTFSLPFLQAGTKTCQSPGSDCVKEDNARDKGFSHLKALASSGKLLICKKNTVRCLPNTIYKNWGFPGGASGKETACQCRRPKRLGFNPWVGKIPWRRKWQPTPVFLPGESVDIEAWWTMAHRVSKSQQLSTT